MRTIEYLLILLIIYQIAGDFEASIINTLFFLKHYTSNFMMWKWTDHFRLFTRHHVLCHFCWSYVQYLGMFVCPWEWMCLNWSTWYEWLHNIILFCFRREEDSSEKSHPECYSGRPADWGSDKTTRNWVSTNCLHRWQQWQQKSWSPCIFVSSWFDLNMLQIISLKVCSQPLRGRE